MKRIRSTYHTLHVFKAADPKLPKGIISKYNQETLKNICECALIVLRGNVPLSACNSCKLRTYKYSIPKVEDKNVFLAAKRKIIGERCGFLLPLLSAILPTLEGLIFRSR